MNKISDWLDALAASVVAAHDLFKDLKNDKRYFTALRAMQLRDNLEKLRCQMESVSNEEGNL